MELQALLLGLEPLTALAIGLGALVLAPVIATTESAVGGALAESSKNLAKTGSQTQVGSEGRVYPSVAADIDSPWCTWSGGGAQPATSTVRITRSQCVPDLP